MNRKAGLYVHVPFCSVICPYCDFAVVASPDAGRAQFARYERYLRCLLGELDLRVGLGEFDTLYLGGGTPSLLDPDDLHRIRERARLAPDVRIFLEANPEDVDEDAVVAWRRVGVETLSLGIQSLDDDALGFLGRRHSAEDGCRAVKLAKRAGFATVSIDLIFGLPRQSHASWRAQLHRAIALEPDHISCYQLTIHERTLFGRRKREGTLLETSNDEQATLLRETHRVLADHGYEGYEVSNFARGAEHRSRHNEKYWNHTPYLGIGPSAHSFDGRKRSWNARSLFAWQKKLECGETPVEGNEVLRDEDLLLELLMLRLRMRGGVDFEEVRERFGIDLLEINRTLVSRLCDEGLIELEGSTLRPTIDGLAVADSLASAFRFPMLSEGRWRRTLQ